MKFLIKKNERPAGATAGRGVRRLSDSAWFKVRTKTGCIFFALAIALSGCVSPETRRIDQVSAQLDQTVAELAKYTDAWERSNADLRRDNLEHRADELLDEADFLSVFRAAHTDTLTLKERMKLADCEEALRAAASELTTRAAAAGLPNTK